jgi:hypothetical protein
MNGTAEAGAKAAGHVRFQRNLTGDTGLPAKRGGGGHHRHGPTDVGFAEPIDHMGQRFGNQAVLPQRAILRGNGHPAAQSGEVFTQLGDIGTGAATEKNLRRLVIKGERSKLFHQKKQGCNTDTATDEATRQLGLEMKTSAEGAKQINDVAGL